MKALFTFVAIALCAGQLHAEEPKTRSRLEAVVQRAPRPTEGKPFQQPGPPPNGALPQPGTPFSQPGVPAGPPPGQPMAGSGFGGSFGGSSFGGAPPNVFMEQTKRTLIIASGKMDSTASDSLREDLNIMSRLLDKAVEGTLDGPVERRMGITVMTLPGARGENIFLEDYGAVFVVNVPILLSSAGKTEGKKTENADSDWEQTKNELYGNHPFTGRSEMNVYEAAKVEALKKKLIEVLKNAANIRGLKNDQTVTVVVAGGEKTDGRMTMKGTENRGVTVKRMITRREGGKEEVEEKIEGGAMEFSGQRQTMLTIRAKKSDIDDFAKGGRTLEEFSKLVKISTY